MAKVVVFPIAKAAIMGWPDVVRVTHHEANELYRLLRWSSLPMPRLCANKSMDGLLEKKLAQAGPEGYYLTDMGKEVIESIQESN